MQISKKVEFRIQIDASPKIEKIISEFLLAIRQYEQGHTLLYKSFHLEQDQTKFIHIMTFLDAAAEMPPHKKAEHTKKFVGKLYPLCTEGPTFENLNEMK